MSLTKLLKAPIKLFKKEVITFVRVRRYDLNIVDDKLRYIAVRPNASIAVLREKVWHLLGLPDFCEEVILLKSGDDRIIPLTDLRKGNEPQHPYFLEVWLPANRCKSGVSVNKKMLTIENGDGHSQYGNDITHESKQIEGFENKHPPPSYCQSIISNETVPLSKLHFRDDKTTMNNVLTDFKKSDLSCRVSTSSIFRINGRKSRDNFTSILLKIQSDISTLSTKLSTLENRITT